MLLKFSSGDIHKLGIYDAKEILEKAVEIKEKFEILVLAAPGLINPAEIERYGKYFKNTLSEDEANVETDMKEFELLKQAMAGRDGR